jgi:hypothetical protein
MNTRAPCGVESIHNPPTNDAFFVSVAELVFAAADGRSGRSRERGIDRWAGGGSDAAGATGTGAGATGAGAGETGSGPRTNGSARGSSDVVNHETRITHISAPKAEPEANDHSPRRSFEVEAAGTGSATASLARCPSCRRTAGRTLTRLCGAGRRVAGLIEAGSEENSSSGSGAHRPLRSWLTKGFVGSIGCSFTQLSRLWQSLFRLFRGRQSQVSRNHDDLSGQKSSRMSFFLSLGGYLR